MEAGPRDTGRDDTRRETDPTLHGALSGAADGFDDDGLDAGGLDNLDGPGPDGLGLPAEPARLTPDGPDAPDSAEAEAASAPAFEVELRPQRRLRLWQIAPIVVLAASGSLMFAFPLAFEFGDGGAVVAMLGFLISCCAGGWGMMAARRVGYALPGLPARGSGRRPDWRVAGLYALVALAVVALAVYRVARLR
ncbi:MULTISPECIES: hypothetical protein [unclassified Streptomyces]|uniref:hypothetical protein n=1 Tax=unclassified Streptomyces TaxID=2593676 RepID=UPI000DC77921|nr:MULTISPECIES: hypothetical protein [unclassified Streptomyces]AWZ07694.1 hypothetical protein DRB89_27250 [Streptomyces sp. ICC4]AWZ15351.1 hypothetical protein DRB96_27320 [Streptomyces sp. ICC1]